MGNQSSATKPKSSLFSKRTKNGVSPLMLPTSLKKDISPQTKSTGGRRRGTLETLSNIANNSTFSFKTKGSSTDQISEDTSRFAQTLPSIDANSNSPSTIEDLDIKKPFQHKKGPLIGKGFYGDVFECLNLSSGELLAVKSIKIEGDISRFQNYIEALKREILILKALSHPNVIKYYAVDLYEAKNESYSMIDIISEYVSGGSIKVLVGKFDKLDERVISSYTKQILEGLAYLHSKDILHRNMKSSNVLIDACGTAKLTDFGCFKSLEKFVETNNQEYRKSPIPNKSPVYWTAPEVLMKKSQGKPADIWGVGCVVLEMLTNSPPWGTLNLSLDLVSKQIMSGVIPPLPSTVSEECQDFLNQVFKFRPEDRPTACELLDHPFIRDSLPSLTCIDMEGSQTLHLSQTGIKSIENLQEDVRSRPSTTSSKPRSQKDLFSETQQEPTKQQFSIHVGGGENKIIPKRSRKRSSTSGVNQGLNNNSISIQQNEVENSADMIPISLPKLTIKRVSSQEILRDDDTILTPGKASDRLNTGPKEHKIVQSPTFKTISKVISPQEASKYNFNYTPIRNSFFNERSRKASIPINSQPESSRERPVLSTAPQTETTGSTTNQEENVYLNTSELRKQQEELVAQTEGAATNLFTEDDEEKRKMELRRKYEEQMQQELIDMNQSNTSEIWGLRAH